MKSVISLFWSFAQNRSCFAGANVLARKRKWNENLSLFKTMYGKPLSLVPVCLPWQASPLSRWKNQVLSAMRILLWMLKKKKRDRKEKQNNKTITLQQIIHNTQSRSMKGDLFWLSYNNKNKETFSNCPNDSSRTGCQKQQISDSFRAVC